MQIEFEEFRKRLRVEKAFIPNNKDFNADCLQRELLAWMTTNTIPYSDALDHLAGTCRFLPTLNQAFAFLARVHKKTITEMGLPKESAIEALVALVNITYLSAAAEVKSELARRSEAKLTDLFALQTDSLDAKVGSVNTAGALADMIDILGIALNEVQENSEHLPALQASSDGQSISALNAFWFFCNAHFGFKSAYDSAIWNNGDFIKLGTNKYAVRFANTEKLIIEEIGRFRVQQDSFTESVRIINEGFENPHWNQRKRKNVCITDIRINDGTIGFTLGEGIDQSEERHELRHLGAILAFYGFLENVELPKYTPLKLWDFLLMFHMVQHLYTKISDTVTDGGDCHTVAEVKKYTFSLVKEDLKKYLLGRTTYSETEIGLFLSSLIKPESERINFWNHPFIQSGEKLLGPLNSITGPMIFHVIDRWLEKGGYTLESRGRALEKYIARKLVLRLTEKGYFHKIPDRKKFKTATGEAEEIDLMINLKDIVIIAEVKCIRYSFDIRDYHNCYERLSYGCSQVTRKAAYMEKHAGHFHKDIGDISNKRLVKLVITNYPTFAGSEISGVPIVDFRWLEAFVTHNQVIHYTLRAENNGYSNQVQKATTLYRNETEFNHIFETQMKKPALVELFRPNVELKETLMTIGNSPIELSLQMAKFV